LGGVAAFKNKKTWERTRAETGKAVQDTKTKPKRLSKSWNKNKNDQVLIMILKIIKICYFVTKDGLGNVWV